MRHAKVVTISQQEQDILEQIIGQPSSPQGLVMRSEIILGAAAGMKITAQAESLGTERNTVQKWRERWRLKEQARIAGQETGKLRIVVEQVLADAPRSGTPAKFSAEQMVPIVAVAGEEPSASGYPVSHWSLSDLVDECVKRGIVTRISERQIGRFLKRGGFETPS